jgi:hypothetical protein
MTREEILKKLEENGIKTGQWQHSGEREVKVGPHLSGNMQGLLGELGSLLQRQISEDVQKVQVLREALQRLKHGGGR